MNTIIDNDSIAEIEAFFCSLRSHGFLCGFLGYFYALERDIKKKYQSDPERVVLCNATDDLARSIFYRLMGRMDRILYMESLEKRELIKKACKEACDALDKVSAMETEVEVCVLDEQDLVLISNQ